MPLTDVHNFIDHLWCDIEGVYVRGWVHCLAEPITRLYIRSGNAIAEITERLSRADVAALFPGLPNEMCGYTCYLACLPFRPVFIGVTTKEGSMEWEIDVAAFPHLHEPDAPGAPDLLAEFSAEMKAKRGRVVEIGARAVSPGAKLLAERFAPECTFIGVDVHEAPGVDIVADAHFLSRSIEPGSVDGVYSLAVLEHVAAPWLVAAEINKILKVGGLTMHSVPQSFPIHEMPNDFWRMTDVALQILFGPDTGFELVKSGMSNPVRMFTNRSLRKWPYLEFPLFPGMSESHIVARKVADLEPGAVRWPYRTLEQLGPNYPSHKA